MSAIELTKQAVQILRENVRHENGILYAGVRDNDKTRAAIVALIDGSEAAIAEADRLRVALEMHDAIESKTNAENEQLREEVSMFEATTKHQDTLLVTMKGEFDKLQARVAELELFCLITGNDDIHINKVRAEAVREAFLQLASELRREKSTGITIKGLIHEAEIKANQIEGGES